MREPREITAGSTSLSLLERARARDDEAWRRLVQLYGPLVFFWARRSALSDADAADLVQDVWQSVATALPRFRRDEGSGTFRGWLWTVARNKLNDFFRKRASGPDVAGGTDAQMLLQDVSVDEPIDKTEENALLHRALEQICPEFQERTWAAFWKVTLDGRSARDVAVELGMAPNAIHQAKFRVLRRLREEMTGLVEMAVI